MNRWIAMLVSSALVLATFNSTVAQQNKIKDELVGTWRWVSATVERDGKTFEPFGSNPVGYMIFTTDGHFAWNMIRADIPKFASNNRLTGTPEENKSAVQGNISAFGTYTIDLDGVLTLQIIGSSFPNWTGTTQKRLIEITGDHMRYSTPGASIGGSAINILTRAK